MSVQTSAPVAVKAAPAKGMTGEVSAVVAVFGNVDLYGDRIVKGAFADTLEAWGAKDGSIPFIWSHRWDDPMYHLGAVDDAEESDEGLHVKATMDLSTEVGAQVHRLLAERRVTEFSFAYDAKEWSYEEEEDRDWPVRNLLALDVIEVGPTLKGANPATRLEGVKLSPRLLEQSGPQGGPYVLGDAAVRALGVEGLKGLGLDLPALGAKAGRVLSKANEGRVKAARDALSEVLDQLGDEDSKALPSGEAERARLFADLLSLEA